jgi:hypothetical protein
MAKSNGNEPTQTTPAGEEIPIPEREKVLRDLGELAKPQKPMDRDEENETE